MNQDINSLLNQIKGYNVNGNFKESYNLLSSAIGKITDNVLLKNEFMLEMGQCLCGMGKHEEAKKYFEEVIKFDSQNIYALEGLLKVADNEYDYDFIIKTAKKINKLEYIDLYSDKLINKMNSYVKLGLKDEFMRIYNLLKDVCFLFDKKKQNIILNEYEILNKKIILKSKPRFLHVVVTNRCNINCIMCVQDKKIWELPKKFYDEILELMQYAEQLTWHGGEIFLYKNFFNLFREAIRNKCHQSIITNGLLLSREFMELAIQNKVCLTISIDAVEKKLYESIRVGASFDKLIENLKFIKTIRLKYKDNKAFSLKMSVVVMKQNIKFLNDIINFAVEYGFNEIIFYPHLYFDKHKLSEFETRVAFDTIEKMKKNNKINSLIKIETTIEPMLNDNKKQRNNLQNIGNRVQNNEVELLCYAPWKRLYIGENGIRPESQCNTDDTSLDYENLWNSKSMQMFRKCILFGNEYKNNTIRKHCETFCMNTGEIGRFLRE